MTHVHRPAPAIGIAFGVVLLVAIGLPAVVMQPLNFSAVAGLLLCLSLAGALVALGMQHVDCMREGDQLRMRHVRWPFGTVERVVPLGRITRIEARLLRSSRHVVITLDDGSEVPVPGGGSGSSSHEETASVLRGWCNA